jgi:bile acid:Na+ symporter, BASS family
MCSAAFSSGWFISKIFKTNKSDMAALMFGLGMNNNGTGLVFATATLSDHPAVLLPIVFYTLIQQILAATIDHLYFQDKEPTEN